jgi:hypothetical protein
MRLDLTAVNCYRLEFHVKIRTNGRGEASETFGIQGGLPKRAILCGLMLITFRKQCEIKNIGYGGNCRVCDHIHAFSINLKSITCGPKAHRLAHSDNPPQAARHEAIAREALARVEESEARERKHLRELGSTRQRVAELEATVTQLRAPALPRYRNQRVGGHRRSRRLLRRSPRRGGRRKSHVRPNPFARNRPARRESQRRSGDRRGGHADVESGTLIT